MIKQLGAAILMSGFALSASANNFFIDRGVNGDADPDTVTSVMKELGYSGTLATSIYFGTSPGAAVVDTNISGIMQGLFSSGDYTTLNGNTLTTNGFDPFNNTPIQPDQIDINTLNPAKSPVSREGYGLGVPNGFQFLYQYMLFGNINATGTAVNFTSGFFNLFMSDNDASGVLKGGVDALGNPTGDARQVMRVLVNGSVTSPANLDVLGSVDYSFCEPTCSTEVKNLFHDAASGTSFYDIWKSSTPPPVISFVLDTNVNPPVPTNDQLVGIGPLFGPAQSGLAADCSAVGAPVGSSCAVRQTTLDGSVTFKVPEPGSLALVGLGLLGFGLRRRKA